MSTTTSVDKNGIAYLPLPAGYSYTNESDKPKENFRSDGSYRLDFTGERDSVCVGALMTVGGPKDEEIAGKLLGSHNTKLPNSGSYVIGIRLDGTRIRLRKEIHPDYTKTLKSVTRQDGDLRKRPIFVQYWKINMPDGTVLLKVFMDFSGLGADGKPQNKWEEVFSVIDDGNLGYGKWKPIWLKPTEGPQKSQNTVRVDGQKKKSYKYQFAFCREIIQGEIPPHPQKCIDKPNSHWDEATQTCVCNDGFHDENGVCVKNPIPPGPSGDLDEHGIKMLHPVTGKFVEVTAGNDHPNGQRYSKNHQFGNYMWIGFLKLGKGQDVMEHKTDGPNHGGCNAAGDAGPGKKFPITDCCWVEVNISLTDRKKYKKGQFYLSSEHPHPDNFDAPDSAIGDKIFDIKPESWIGYAACAWQEGKYRRYQGWVCTDPFDADGKPTNKWELGIDQVDKGQITTPELALRDVQSIALNHVKDKSKDMVGLESEIRMNNATNHDCKIQWARVYELAMPVQT